MKNPETQYGRDYNEFCQISRLTETDVRSICVNYRIGFYSLRAFYLAFARIPTPTEANWIGAEGVELIVKTLASYQLPLDTESRLAKQITHNDKATPTNPLTK